METEHLDVVADVADHGDRRRLHDLDEAAQEPGAPDAAGEHDDTIHVAETRGSALPGPDLARTGDDGKERPIPGHVPELERPHVGELEARAGREVPDRP